MIAPSIPSWFQSMVPSWLALVRTPACKSPGAPHDMEAGIDLAKVRCMELQELKEATNKYARESASMKASLARLNYQKQQLLLDLSLLRGYIALKTDSATPPGRSIEIDSLNSMTHGIPALCSPAPVPAAVLGPPAVAHASMHGSATKRTQINPVGSQNSGCTAGPTVQQPQKPAVTSQQEGAAKSQRQAPLTTVQAPPLMVPSSLAICYRTCCAACGLCYCCCHLTSVRACSS